MHDADTLVIGAGAAGLAAACFSKQKTVVCERMQSAGRKLLATGGARCNLTHDTDPDGVMRNFGCDARFMAPALYNFPPVEIRNFFHANGVRTVIEPDGCVFPASQKAGDILQALLRKAEANGAQIQTSVTVDNIVVERVDQSSSRITRVLTSAGTFSPRNVILATGGMSYPALGSNGSGFKLARSVGLDVESPLPALAGLKTAQDWPAEATGIVLENAALRLVEKGSSKKWFHGEVLFTHQGLSAPPALNLSGEAAWLLSRQVQQKSCQVKAELNMDCSRTREQWLEIFDTWRSSKGGRAVHNLLSGELPRNLARILCRQAQLTDCAVARAPKQKLVNLGTLLSACPLSITGVDGWNKAMVTRGGVVLNELNPQTLACRKISNLYCIGEVVNLDGACGGYNLTWAFASGALAAAQIIT